MEDRGSWKVGLITLVAIVGVVGMLAFLVPGIRNALTGRGWGFYIIYADAGGLLPAEKLTLSGVSVGTVESVKLVTRPDSPQAEMVAHALDRIHAPAPSPPYALVHVTLSKDTAGQLFRYYNFQVGSTSMIGTSHQITVMPVAPPEGANPEQLVIRNGDVIEGTAALSIVDLAKPAAGMMNAITNLTNKMQDLVADPRLKDELLGSLDQVRGASTNMRLASAQILKLSSMTEAQLGGALPHVGNSLANFEALTANFKSASDQLPDIMGQVQSTMTEARKNMVGAARHTNEAMSNIDDTTSQLKTFVTKSGAIEDLHDTVASLKTSTVHLNAALANLQSLSGSPEVQKDLPQIISNLKAASAQLTPTLVQAQSTLASLQSVGQTANGMLHRVDSAIPSSGKGKQQAPVRAAIGLHSGIGILYSGGASSYYKHRGIVDPEFQINAGSHQFDLGLFDIGGANLLNAEIGAHLLGQGSQGLNLRYGVYRSRVGIGTDWLLGHGLGIYGTLYDANRPTIDLESTIDLGPNYSLWTGIDTLNRQPQFVAGIRVKP